MAKQIYKVKSKVFLYAGDTPWHFTNVDKELSAELREKYAKKTRGFGSLKVEVRIGTTKWKTSIFPDKRSGTYLLPLKAAVRAAEGIAAEDTITFTLSIL